MKALGVIILVLLLAGCQTSNYWRLNQAPRHDANEWASISRVVGQQINK